MSDQSHDAHNPVDDPEAGPDTVNRESNPNADSDDRLAGGMGVSSERRDGFTGIESMGTQASAQHATDGESPTVRVEHEDVESSVDLDKPDETALVSNVDRTVGEIRPDPVENVHEFDPDRNPRH